MLAQLRITIADWLLKDAGKPTRKTLGVTDKGKKSSAWQPPMRRKESRLREK